MSFSVSDPDESAVVSALRRRTRTQEGFDEGILLRELQGEIPHLTEEKLLFYIERYRRRGSLVTTRMSPEDDAHEGELLIVYWG